MTDQRSGEIGLHPLEAELCDRVDACVERTDYDVLRVDVRQHLASPDVSQPHWLSTRLVGIEASPLMSLGAPDEAFDSRRVS